MRKIILSVLFVLGLLLCANYAFAYTIDGSLADWGVRPGLYSEGVSQWIPNAGVYYNADDQDPAAPLGYVGPGYGGQPFDAEAIYADFDGTNLYFAVVTGYPNPRNGTTYAAGDIAFDFGIDDVYPYGDSYEYGIETVGNGLAKGGLYSVTTWGQGLDNWGTGYKGNISAPAEILTINGTKLAQGSLAYVKGFYINGGGTKVYYSGSHYVIEGYIPLDGFGDDWGRSFRMHWTQTCGNNFINLDVVPPPIPEPATLSLLGLGLVGLLGLRKKRED